MGGEDISLGVSVVASVCVVHSSEKEGVGGAFKNRVYEV